MNRKLQGLILVRTWVWFVNEIKTGNSHVNRPMALPAELLSKLILNVCLPQTGATGALSKNANSPLDCERYGSAPGIELEKQDRRQYCRIGAEELQDGGITPQEAGLFSPESARYTFCFFNFFLYLIV